MSKLRNRIQQRLNAAINIAHALTRHMEWEDIPGELADAAGSESSSRTLEVPNFSRGGS